MHDYLDDEDLISEIIDDQESPPITRAPKDVFQAWHLPRKQFVRVKQWVELLSRNRSKILNDKNILKYLSLPGDDLLDLRVIHDEFCAKHNVILSFLGYNRFPSDTSHPRHYDINLSLVEVKEKTYIDSNSQVINYDINNIGVKGSPANIEANKHGPYDVINLDFCDSIFTRNNTSVDTLNLLDQILFIQSAKRTPWLMYVTTRIGEKNCDEDVISKLIECFQENLQHAEFANASEEKFGIKNADDIKNSMLNYDKHAYVTLISLLKWLLNRCFNYNPKSKIELSSTISYIVEKDANGFDMVSFALLFTPIINIPIDKYDLVTGNESQPEISEPELAVKFIDRALANKNCDAILSNNQVLKDQMIYQTKDLLSKARYDIDKYEHWLNTHFSSTSC